VCTCAGSARTLSQPLSRYAELAYTYGLCCLAAAEGAGPCSSTEQGACPLNTSQNITGGSAAAGADCHFICTHARLQPGVLALWGKDLVLPSCCSGGCEPVSRPAVGSGLSRHACLCACAVRACVLTDGPITAATPCASRCSNCLRKGSPTAMWAQLR